MANGAVASVAITLSTGTMALAQDSSTWNVIQHTILNDNCAGCHEVGREGAGRIIPIDEIGTDADP